MIVNRLPCKLLLLKSLFSAVLLTGCAVGPDYQAPDIAPADDYKYEDGWQTARAEVQPLPADWWQVFGDAELTALVEQAMQANQTLAQAEASYRAAEAQWRGSRSDYFPTLDLSVSQSRSGGDNTPLSERSAASLNLSWAPDVWGRVRRQVESQKASLQGSAADLAAVRLSIQLSVAQSYIRLRVLDLQRQILEETMATYDRSARLTNNQYKAGIVSRGDVIQAETQRQSLRADMIDLQNQRALEENTIAVLLGKAPVEFSLPPKQSLPDLPALPEVLPSTLIAKRPDVAFAERQLAAANADIGVAQAAWLPSFSISASQGVQAASFSVLLDTPTMVWSVGPSLAQTLFDGGSRRAAVAVAKAQYQQRLGAYRQAVLEGIAEVESALASIQLLGDKAEQQDKLLDLAEENERIIVNRYEAGMINFLEVATAQNLTLSARRAKLSNTAERLQAALQLAAVIGGPWDSAMPVSQSVSEAQTATAP
ncbi:efflux transporter outer membrane subunit [Spongiibacter tropicus]|uniref:efflux transporter outer membrane subunit n=1 Tax=Spongiibacter tropicus TaxID=454602 RepID=UPI002352AB4F|nr:efflux transporter outer membrane subunit [Spongiibacter tropicus]|tara:strand:+ start:1914 stop:3362 length:1449 start_codon:yes stop_codon:yes gene_type:complete